MATRFGGTAVERDFRYVIVTSSSPPAEPPGYGPLDVRAGRRPGRAGADRSQGCRKEVVRRGHSDRAGRRRSTPPHRLPTPRAAHLGGDSGGSTSSRIRNISVPDPGPLAEAPRCGDPLIEERN